jgi:glycosyltransferase involved in cell wall biosynthesis
VQNELGVKNKPPINLLFVHCNTTGSWICDKYAQALQRGGAKVELVELRYDGGKNVIRGLCDGDVPQRTFGFHHQFRTKVRVLKSIERLGVDARKLLELARFRRYIRASCASHCVATDPLALNICVSCNRNPNRKIFYLPFEHYRDLLGVSDRRRRQFITLEQANLPKVTAAIYCGDTLRDDYVAAYGFAERSHVIYNGWPLALRAKSKSLRAAIDAPSDAVLILYQGVIDSSRGLDDLVSAMVQVSSQARAVIIGYGVGVDQLKRRVAERKLEGRVFVLPPVSQLELMNYTADADVGIIPLRNEHSHRFACPGKLFELIGAGLPLVVSDMPDLRRFVTDYGLGEVFRSADVQDLARALNALVNSGEHRKQCSRNAQKLHEQNVCWELQSGKMCEIILS